MISIYKAEYIFFLFCSTLILSFITITMFFFIEGYNFLAWKRQFWYSASDSFKNLVSIIIHYLSLFKITKSGLKRICGFFFSKIKLLTQFTNMMLLKLFSLAALLFFSLMRLALDKIEALWPYANPRVLKLLALVFLFFFLYDCF